VPHFCSPILKLLTRHDNNCYWCHPPWRGDDRLGLSHRTTAIRLKYEDHWRLLCRTCELVEAHRTKHVPVASVCGSTVISCNTQQFGRAPRVSTSFLLDSWPKHPPSWQAFVVSFSSRNNAEQYLDYTTTAFSKSFPVRHSQVNLPSTLRTVR
jgi:hypothetical protein